MVHWYVQSFLHQIFQAHDDPEAAAQLALIDDLEIKYNMAEKHFENKNYEDSLFLLNSLIDMMNFDHKLRQMRSKCYFEKGDIQKVILQSKGAYLDQGSSGFAKRGSYG